MSREESAIPGWEGNFPALDLISISFNALPIRVLNFIDELKRQYARQTIREVYQLNELLGLRHIVVITSIETKGTSDGIAIEVFNLGADNEILGNAEGQLFGELRNDILYDNQPLVSNTLTQEGSLRMGLGMRRLLLLNYFFTTMKVSPLRSSKEMSYEARKVWEKLHTLGLVEVFAENDNCEAIYRFVR